LNRVRMYGLQNYFANDSFIEANVNSSGDNYEMEF
jgi:hypothetical protein